ncbi:hypothetical protein P4234_24230 [Pseudomonas aeruginosa]|nr:hypothetical protein [Pseudomonas aeruginosa]
MLGLLVACLVCVGCLGWNTILQLRLQALQLPKPTWAAAWH